MSVLTLPKLGDKHEHEICQGMFYTDDGRPWHLNKMPFFIPIYNNPASKILLKTSRQSTKTTFLRNKLTFRSVMRRGNAALYIAPTNNQVRDFSKKKLDTVFSYNKELRQHFISKACDWNVHFKQFTSGSSITLRSTGGHQGAEGVRGNTANDILIDEYQSMADEHIPIILECAATFDGKDGRPLAYYGNTGTPLSYQNPIEMEWGRSKGYEWHIRCPHCGNWQEPLGMNHIDLGKPYLFCQRCSRDLNRAAGTPRKFDGPAYDELDHVPQGSWHASNPKGRFPGYRIVRLMMPWARWRTENSDGILDRLESWPERRFVNEIMGLPFDGGNAPLTEKNITDICTSEDRLPRTEAEEYAIAHKYASDMKVAGLDWAMNNSDATASYTNLGIFAIHRGKMRLIYAHKFVGAGSSDPDEVNRFIAQKMERFDVTLMGADYGVGYSENQRLRALFPRRVATMHYSGSSTLVRSKWDPVGQKWMIPRTASLEELVHSIKVGRIELPAWEDCQSVVSDWLRVTLEISDHTRTVLYRRNGTDDFFHVTNYAHLAWRMMFSSAPPPPTDTGQSYGVSTPLGA
jgi:hypothetical protein